MNLQRQTIFSVSSVGVPIRNTADYSPFGVQLGGRTIQGDFYRRGFNGMEKDDEVKGGGNSYDFGARMYDGRVGRFLSLDPKKTKFPSFSHYSYAVNSPIIFIDNYGEDPKVVILFYADNDYGFDAFEKHKEALEKAGYTVVRVKNGEHLLEVLGQYSCPESPIENLILISHGSPGGPEMTTGKGSFWTESELRIRAEQDWKTDKMEELAKVQGLELYDYTKENFDIVLKDKLQKKVNKMAEFWGDTSPNGELKIKQELEDYKKKNKTITICDFVDAMDSKKIHLSSTWTAVFAGCNLAGKFELDNQEIFTTSFAIQAEATTYGSQGQTGPNGNSTVRVSNSDSNIRDLLGHFIKTTSDGKREKKGNKIDMANPEK